MENTPVVSIILLACNKVKFTARCLDALLKSDYPAVELWLVNNGSSDHTSELFDHVAGSLNSRVGWTVKRLDFEKNIGAIQGRNAALEEMTGRYVIFIDNDVVVSTKDWLDKLVARMEDEVSLGIIGVKLVYPKPENILQCAGCVVTKNGRVDFFGRGKEANALEYNHEREVQCLISALWIMRREVVDRIGLLDMAYHPVQFEDIDYCYRCREAGWKLLYFPGVTAYHYENVTTGGTNELNYRYLTVKNGLTFKKKWRHMFSKEDGPADESIIWEDIPRIAWDDVESYSKTFTAGTVQGEAEKSANEESKERLKEKLDNIKHKYLEINDGQSDKEGEIQMEPSETSRPDDPQPENENEVEEHTEVLSPGEELPEEEESDTEAIPEESDSEEGNLPEGRLANGLRFGFIAVMLLFVILLISYRDVIRHGTWGDLSEEISSDLSSSGEEKPDSSGDSDGAAGIVLAQPATPEGSEAVSADADNNQGADSSVAGAVDNAMATAAGAEAEKARIAAATMKPNATPWNERAITGYIPKANIVIYAKSGVLQLRSFDQTVRFYRNITAPTSPLTGKAILGKYSVITAPNSNPDYLYLNYPNANNAEEALQAGKIDQESYDLIVKAAEEGSAPLSGSSLGGPLIITATQPAGGQYLSIKIKQNSEMQELIKGIPPGIPVEIVDR